MDFECKYIRTHTGEKRLKLLSLYSPFCFFLIKKYFNLIATLSFLESTYFDETVKCAWKCFILTQKNAKSTVLQCQVFYFRTTHCSTLKAFLF